MQSNSPTLAMESMWTGVPNINYQNHKH